MIQFSNAHFSQSLLVATDLFICTIGYEARSYYLYDQIKNEINKDQTLFFTTDNYTCNKNATEKISEIQGKQFNLEVVKYQDSSYVLARIKKMLKQRMDEKSAVTISIDYSSMPRSWYCKLPAMLAKILRPTDLAYFWYCEGCYQADLSNYPTAGIDSFQLISGRPSLLPDKRAHIFGLSYDSIRTQGIISVLDPEYVIVCEAHDPNREDIYKNLIVANEDFMARAAMIISLDLSDFTFMLSKLRELTNESIATSDVVFVPDGPKPLILAMSLIPDMINRTGVSCIHAIRNYDKFVPIEVIASGVVVGFAIEVKDNQSVSTDEIDSAKLVYKTSQSFMVEM